tara:strand:- start:1075 stop:1329 length:255 start_codon:yes stop_codon:yes gene_type:complete
MEIRDVGKGTIQKALRELFEECGSSDEVRLQIAILALEHIGKTLPNAIKAIDLTAANTDILGCVSSCEIITRSVLEVLKEGLDE